MSVPSAMFTSVRLEGGLVTPELLRLVHSCTAPGQSAAEYDLTSDTRVIDEVRHHWEELQMRWLRWRTTSAGGVAEILSGSTRDQWQIPLLKALGFHNLTARPSLEVNGRTFPIARVWYANESVRVPIHLVDAGVPLDKRTAKVAGAAQDRPHAIVQGYLNEETQALWGLISDGLVLRVLRDTTSLSRPPFIEFDLVAIFDGQDFATFSLLWLLCHASRFSGATPTDCWLEKWSQQASVEGTRALDSLRKGVEKAIEYLGNGFLSHPANRQLAQAVQIGAAAGGIDKDELFREVLRLVYRIIFVLVAEEREVIHDSSASLEMQTLYKSGYALGRVRDLALNTLGTGHNDLWRSVSVVFEKLAESGAPELGLNPLGSFLFLPSSTPHLVGAGTFETPADSVRLGLASWRVEMRNCDFLSALRALCVVTDTVTHKDRSVDFRTLGAEELGSVYEGLLELHLDSASWPESFRLATGAGNERKTSGSYYTPDSLVQCLLDSALEPVIAQAVKAKTHHAAAEALLNLKICDPAVGSGHFLIAAAHRLAKHVARARAGTSEPTPDEHRAALRDVIRRCLYGVDINPMSAELCKVALWMESMEPGKPLSFLDSHVQVGNSLVGTTPALISLGIPEGAFDPIEGDVKTVCSALKKQNKKELSDRIKGQSTFDFGHVAPAPLGGAFAAISQGEDSNISVVARRAEDFARLTASIQYQNSKLIADAWCSAFFWRKDGTKIGGMIGITDALLREIESHPDRFPLGNPIRDEIERLARVHQFFHWHIAFPEVFDAAGVTPTLAGAEA